MTDSTFTRNVLNTTDTWRPPGNKKQWQTRNKR